MPSKDDFIRVAIHEISQQTYASTQQCLAEHSVELLNGQPVVYYIDEVTVEDGVIIYFRLHAAEYFMAVPVQIAEHGLKCGIVTLEPLVSVKFIVYSASISPEELSNRLKLEPYEYAKKGSPIAERSTKVLTHHVWKYEPEKNIPRHLSEKVSNLLRVLKTRQNELDQMASNCKYSIWVHMVGPADFSPGMRFTPDVLRIIGNLGCYLDLDLYFMCPDRTDSQEGDVV